MFAGQFPLINHKNVFKRSGRGLTPLVPPISVFVKKGNVQSRNPCADLDSKSNAPGKNAASTKPKKKRQITTPVKLEITVRSNFCINIKGCILFCDTFINCQWRLVRQIALDVPVKTEIKPQMIIDPGKYQDGFLI